MAEEYLTEESSRPEPPKIWLWVKNLFIFLALLAIVVGSFWLSFQLGKKILVPVRKPRIEVPIPEPPPSLKTLEKLQQAITKEVEEKTVKVQKERVFLPPLKEVKKKTEIQSVCPGKKYYKVQAGWLKSKDRAIGLSEKLKSKGFEVFVKKIYGGWRVQVGAFKSKAKAEDLQKKLKREGFDAVIVYE